MCIAGGKKGAILKKKGQKMRESGGRIFEKIRDQKAHPPDDFEGKAVPINAGKCCFPRRRERKRANGTGFLSEFREEEKWNVGSVLNFQGAAEARRVQTRYLEKTAHGIPLLFMQDEVHGYKTIYPVNLGLCCPCRRRH